MFVFFFLSLDREFYFPFRENEAQLKSASYRELKFFYRAVYNFILRFARQILAARGLETRHVKGARTH